MATKAQIEKRKRSMGYMDIMSANESMKLVITKFLDGELDEVSYCNAVSICTALYRYGCRDLNWTARLDSYHNRMMQLVMQDLGAD